MTALEEYRFGELSIEAMVNLIACLPEANPSILKPIGQADKLIADCEKALLAAQSRLDDARRARAESTRRVMAMIESEWTASEIRSAIKASDA